MREWADFTVEERGGRATLALHGPLTISSIGLLDRKLREFDGSVQAVDLSAAGDIDTVGAWTVWRFADQQKARITGTSGQADTLIAAVSEAASTAPIRPERSALPLRVLEDLGEKSIGAWDGTVRVIGFIGQIVRAAGSLLVHPRRFPLRALVRQMELVGVTALPIVGLMSFLIGVVIAQQGAAQLRQFGAEIYTINLTGRLSFRELGVLMTAIMVAGRSGSAFAAQLGTMKLTEEIDAMRTIGVSPMEVLVLPRIMAAVIMMPLLGFFAAAIAVVGGAVIADLTLGIPFLTFLLRIQEVVPLHDLWVGLIKAPVFGLILALAGCYQGMQVEGNSEEVGLRTTKAVVQAIFSVIVLDAFFAVFFDQLGWG
ncbi:MAG: ABC transporter permease [Sphingomonadales bacterium 32-68-7]|nr:MAG: ABC transporter permease [Sphingomonadales bacterium 12-68-11]OYX08447.1 MAG: ABC transporter permease [Sphingomonadales bacterium 32-68-7]